MKKLKEYYKQHRSIILYGAIGCSGAIMDFTFFLLLYKIFEIPPSVASFLSVSLGILNNFLLNSYYNFKTTDKLAERFARFYGIGLGGALLSSVMIFVLHDLLVIQGAMAKLLTILPVVLLQYCLNKRYSFSSRQTTGANKSYALLKEYKLLILLNIIFALCCFAFVANIQAKGPNTAPDEETHYNYNVRFIIQNHRLPISGKDDVDLLQSCRDTTWGKVPCTYSYQAYPGMNYLVSATGSWFLHKAFGFSYLTGARLVSVGWGLIFINAIFMIVLIVTNRKSYALTIAAIIATLPQIIFIFSYVNQDAHSLSISALLGLGLVGLTFRTSKFWWYFTGVIAGGLLPLTKLNYYLLFVFVAAYLLVMIRVRRVHIVDIRRLLIGSLLGLTLISGFWLIRNISLYGDPIGQSYTIEAMSQYHSLGSPKPLTLLSIQEVFQLNFFETTFRSFFLTFGPMSYYAAPETYAAVKLVLAFFAISTLHAALSLPKIKRKKALLLIASFILLLFLALGLMIHNALVYDFQPQGRYLYEIIMPFVLALSVLIRLDRKFGDTSLTILAAGSVFLFISGFDVFMRKVLTL